MIKVALAEIVHAVWKFRNEKIFKNDQQDTNINRKVIENIVSRVWMKYNMREQIALLLLR